MRFYNTATRRVEEFAPLLDNEVRMYACGPTVYHDVHLGNLRTFLFEDVLKRALRLHGYTVKHVMNITDVGHLVGDGDAGEDKLQKAAVAKGMTAWDIAKHYTELFLSDLKAVHIETPDILSKATEHIPEQITLIQELEQKGFTYRTTDGIYFDTAKFPDYGKLGGQKASEKKAGARVEMTDEKRNPTDFALWKFSPTGEKRHMEWESPWGVGFPGWHIECSAMAARYLGQPFDIHCGGMDLIPVHHENEIAQSEAAHDKPLARFWMHGEFLLMDEKKMSKSTGVFATARDLATQGIDPLSYRFFTFSAHYRSKLNFTEDAVRAVQTSLRKLRAVLRTWDKPDVGADPFETKMQKNLIGAFKDALGDDLNMPKAVEIMWSLVKDHLGLLSRQKAATLLYFDQVLGMGFERFIGEKVEVPAAVRDLVSQREAARAAKNWAESDRLRDAVMAQGFEVLDTPSGQVVLPKE